MAETILDLQDKITELENTIKELQEEDKRLCTIISDISKERGQLQKTVHKQSEIIELQQQIIEVYREWIELQLIKAVLDAVITQGIKVSSIDDVPVNVYLLDDTIYPLSFILDETDDLLTIAVTDPDGFERAKIIPKENLSSIEIVYQQDLEPPTTTPKNEDKMYQ